MLAEIIEGERDVADALFLIAALFAFAASFLALARTSAGVVVGLGRRRPDRGRMAGPVDSTSAVVRALVFALGLLLLLDAVLDDPTAPLVIVVALVLMGVISVDQLRALIARRDVDRGGSGERAEPPPPPGHTSSEPQP